LGPLKAELAREPDIVVRFEEHLALSNLHYLGPGKVGYTDEGFYVLRSSKKDAKVRIDFDNIGDRLEIVCETGLKSVPLLLDILNLTLLKKDVVALHASAFRFHDQGILVTGWAKGGKTEALLSFARHGAEYVGDEWIYLTADGQSMYGVPENIRLWDWNLDNLPHLKQELGFEKRMLFSTIHSLEKFEGILPTKGAGKIPPIKFLREALPAFQRQLNVQLPPQTIFEKCSDTFSARPDKVFLLLSHASQEYRVEKINPAVVARQMVSSLRFEFIRFMEHYYAFRFAFPDRGNQFIESVASRQFGLLSAALAGKKTYAVLHPYPLSFEKLYETMRPHVMRPAQETINTAECTA